MTNLYPALIAFIACFTLIPLLIPVAKKIGLTDTPGDRKAHKGRIPLIGGIVIWLAIVIATILSDININHAWAFYTAGTLATLLGALDDRYHLSVKIRFAVQIIISLLMAIGAENSLSNLGAIFGPTSVSLSGFSYLFTVICIVGVMNAINMMDGIDGLAGSICMVTLSGIFILNNNMAAPSSQLIFIIIASITAFLIFNLNLLRIPNAKIFLGDAGSMMLGLLIVWLLASSTQGEHAQFRPVTAVWLLALPLIDMAAIMFRRIRKKQSPFKPDRDHLHHICMRADLSDRKSLVFIIFIAAILVNIGIAAERYQLPEYIMLVGFIVFLAVYNYGITHIWKLIKLFRRT